MIKNYNVLIKNNNEVVAGYNLNLIGNDFQDHRKKVLDMLILDFKYLDIDITTKYNLELLSITFNEINY